MIIGIAVYNHSVKFSVHRRADIIMSIFQSLHDLEHL